MKTYFNYFFTGIFLLVAATVFAQKKISEGQFFYNIHASFDGEKTGQGKAVFLQRGKQQRLDILVYNEKERVVFSIWIDLEKENYFKSATNERDTSGALNELIPMSDKKLLVFEKDAKTKKTIQGISTTKQACEMDMPWLGILKFEAYTSDKSNIDAHYALRALFSEFDLHGLPLSFRIYSGKTMEIEMELEKIEYDRPDLVWFDPKLTPHYPFAIQKDEEDIVEYDQVPKRVSNLIWNRSFEANEWLALYTESLFQGMLNAQKAGTLPLEDSVSNKLIQFHDAKNKLIDELKEFSTMLESYNYKKNPEDKEAAKEVFNAKRIELLYNSFLTYIESGKSVTADIFTALNLPKADLTDFLEKLNQMHPEQQFGTTEAYKGTNFRQAQILIQALKQLCLEIELAILNQIKQASTQAKLSFDNLIIFSNSPKPYILIGETYETEIGIGALLQGAKFKASVNGNPLAVRNGKVQFRRGPGNVGTHPYTVKIEMEDPLTNKIKIVEQDFYFEVGAPSVTVAADNMNIFYVEEDNPVSVAAAGVSSNYIEVRISGAGGGSLTKIANGKYNVRVTEVTAANEFCNIEVWDKKNNKKLGAYPFHVRKKFK